MRILVNCALPYANGSLHLGHIAGAYLGADIFVRFQRMSGNEVLFVSGSDEHGTPITLRADKEKTTPAAIAERYHREHAETFRKLGINFSIFFRTSDPEHARTVSEIFHDLQERGFLTERTMIAPFCTGCGRFMPDRYITGTCPNCGFEEAKGDQCDECGKILDPQDLINPVCAICGTVPEFRETNHMFFRLDLLQDRIQEWLETRDFWRPNVISFTKNFVRGGLKERPITRDIEWGVPVPMEGYEKKRVYVWFEALIGYLSAARIYSVQIEKPDYWELFYKNPEVRNYYFIGKDNIPFHSIIWPGIIMGTGMINLPYEVVANEFLRFKGKQFSKSRGIGFTANEMLSLARTDYIRYYMSTILPESSDADFSPEDMAEKVNTELVDKYGNFIHRISSFAFNNSLDLMKGDLDQEDLDILDTAGARYAYYTEKLEKAEVKRGISAWMDLVKECNVYFNNARPWDLVRNEREKCETKLWVAYKLAQYMTMMIYPYIPDSATEMLKRLGVSLDPAREGFSIIDNDNFSTLEKKPSRPFEKIDLEVANPNPLDLRVATVMEAKDHPNADSLYVLKISLGDEKRQLVAGLKRYYTTAELEGARIIIVSNLKKAKLRGEVSEGMLLAADDGSSVKYITVPDAVEEGSSVNIGDYSYNGTGTVEIKDVQSLGLETGSLEEIQGVTAELQGHRHFLTTSHGLAFVSSPVKNGARVR